MLQDCTYSLFIGVYFSSRLNRKHFENYNENRKLPIQLDIVNNNITITLLNLEIIIYYNVCLYCT